MCNLHSGIFENTFNNILINEISSLSTPDIKNSLVIISTLGWVSVFSGTTPGSKKVLATLNSGELANVIVPFA